MANDLYKLRPDRDLQCYFQRPSAIAALSETSADGFTVSGCWREQFDWAVLEWNRDNVFEHPSLRNLPDGDLSGLTLSYEEERENCAALDCSLWPTVDWPHLRIWATGTDGVERLYKVPLKDHATPVAGEYAGSSATFELGGTVTANDYVELVWEAADGVSPWVRHATHMMYYDDTPEGVAQQLTGAVNAGTAVTGMSATAQGAQITLSYTASAGANGNRVGIYANVSGAQTETWQPAWQTMSGGTSPSRWRIDLDFSNLQGYVGPAYTNMQRVPSESVRRMRWTWAADQQAGEFTRSEFRVRVSTWTVTGANRVYRVAGPGSRRIEDDADELVYSGNWQPAARGNYSGGSIRATDSANSSVSLTYAAAATHTLLVGTRKFRNESATGARIAITVDGQTSYEDLAFDGPEDVLVRIPASNLDPGSHTITVSHAGQGVFYFDFFEIAQPTTSLPSFQTTDDTTLATDWDTDHSLAIAPERTAWLMEHLGFRGRANHYVGAMWFYELTRPGHAYACSTIAFSGAPDFGQYTDLTVAGALFQHLNLIGDSAASIAKSFELAINAGATAVRASASGSTLTVWARAMGTAGNGIAIATDTHGSQQFTATVSGPLSGGGDGDVTTMPWAQGWRTDLEATPRLNRAARDWHSSFFNALEGCGIDVTAALSLELQHGDPSVEAGIAQRYPGGAPALLNTPALQTSFSPASLAFWKEAFADLAGLMQEAGITPYLQFGETQWWYFADGSGMPFYDNYTKTAFQTAYGVPMGTITSQNANPADFPRECAFLPTLIGGFTDAIMAHVRSSYPSARFEALYPPDVNDTPLNALVNFPSGHWTPAALDCLKTENFIYTGNRDLDRARRSIAMPGELGFAPEQSAHLVGIGDHTSPWQKERRLTVEAGVASVVLFALDQYCLIGYATPLARGPRRSGLQGF